MSNINPHSTKQLIILHQIKVKTNNLQRLKMIETIERDYYKVTFVRDPLSRMLSAYRDKFTG